MVGKEVDMVVDTVVVDTVVVDKPFYGDAPNVVFPFARQQAPVACCGLHFPFDLVVVPKVFVLRYASMERWVFLYLPVVE